MAFAVLEGLLGLGAAGSVLGLLLGSLFTLSPRRLDVAMTVAAVVCVVGGLAAALIARRRGGPPIYARGSFHGYVLGVPEMEFALLMAALFVGASICIPFFLSPARLPWLRRTAVAVLVAAAGGAAALAARRRR